MRVQLILLLLASVAWAEEQPSSAGGRVDVYADGAIVVVAPGTRVSVQVDPKTRVDAGHLVNFVSGATPVLAVDSVSSATDFREVRHGLDLAVSRTTDQRVTVTGSYVASLESDYTAHGPGVSVSAEILQRMATVTAGWRMRVDNNSVSTGEPISEASLTNELDLRWVQILGRTTRLTGLLNGAVLVCGEQLGCNASPYRYVPAVHDRDVLYTLRERHPTRRIRGAAALRLSQALGSVAALHVGYRYYADTWGVQAHTADLSVAIALFGERLILRPKGRFTWQTAASFWSEGLGQAVPEFRTADRELSGLWNVSVGATAELAFFTVGRARRLAPTLRVQHTWYRYPDYAALPSRNAWLIGGGLDAEF